MTLSIKTNNQPWFYIPTLYFAEGVPYIIINTVSVIIYKNMGEGNAKIAFWTSLLYLPWIIKMFWGPLVDLYSTKRSWILLTQIALMGIFGLAAFSFRLESFFAISLIAFTLGAFISATHDIAADGFYLLALTEGQQERFAGIRTVFYRGAVIFGSGFLVFLSGTLGTRLNNIGLSWTLTLGFTAVIFGALFLYHRFILPFPEGQVKKPKELSFIKQLHLIREHFQIVIVTYFRQFRILATLAYILLYRLGEAMLLKLATPFMLDKLETGGLGLSTEDVGLAYGTFGILSLTVGGILGGLIVEKYGLKRTIFPLALALNLPNLFYVYMAVVQPGKILVYPLVSLEQFGYGLGFTAFMIYLMKVSEGEYKTSYYAISTGIMALGMMIPGLISGFLQEAVGYPEFFTIVVLLAIPGLITIFFLPLGESHT
jgi:PAT family beta-lactamase induction signal transducer AmpG